MFNFFFFFFFFEKMKKKSGQACVRYYGIQSNYWDSFISANGVSSK
jgi:hypothetical protein